MRSFVFAAAVLAACAVATPALAHPPARAAGLKNPVIAGEFPEPSVLRARDGWYYAYAGGGAGNRVRVARSRDLRGWQPLGDAMPAPPAWAEPGAAIAAPHVHVAGGRYYMYFTAATAADRRPAIGVAVASGPRGPFRPTGGPLVADGTGAMAFDDPRTGARLLYWREAGGAIRVGVLARDRTSFKPGRRTHEALRRGADEPGAPWVVRRGGWYWLFYAGHGVAVARARSPFGPFARQLSGLAAGRPAIATDRGGRDWLLREVGEARALHVDPLVWLEGWPTVPGAAPLGPVSAAHGAAPARPRLMPSDSPALTRLFERLSEPGATPEARAEALASLRRSAELGMAQAMRHLGVAYERGLSVAPDPREAARWLEKAAARGDVPSLAGLGMRYMLGRTVPQDVKRGLELSRRAAELGSAPAMHNVGFAYSRGRGVPVDHAVATAWFRRAAEHGNVASMVIYASRLDEGQGIKADPAMAVHWYRQAAERGDAEGQYRFGLALVRGVGGLTADAKQGGWWLAKAADREHPQALRDLGHLFMNGPADVRNDQLAWRCYALAAELGMAEAEPMRDELEKRLTPEQIAAQRSEIERWRAGRRKKP